MAVELYTKISTSRTAAGKLWTSTTALDHLADDWAVLGTAWNFRMVENTLPSSTSPTWTTRGTLTVVFPADYALDDTFDVLEVRLILTVEFHTDTSPTEGEVRLNHSGTLSNVEVANNGAYAESGELSLEWGAGSEPTGQQDILIQGRFSSDPGGDTLYIRRSLEKNNCYLYVRKA